MRDVDFGTHTTPEESKRIREYAEEAFSNPMALAKQSPDRVLAKLEFEAQLESNHSWAAITAQSHS